MGFKSEIISRWSQFLLQVKVSEDKQMRVFVSE